MVLAEETTEFGASQDHVEPADKDGLEVSHVDTFWCRTVKIGQDVSTRWAKKFEKISNFSPFRDFMSINLRNH